MRILFTGASSFTGFWFVSELAKAKNEIFCTFRSPEDSYINIRKTRVQVLREKVHRFFEIEFGTEKFLELIKKIGSIDLFCHHAADVTNYKSPSFNIISALENNTRNISEVFLRLKENGCENILLTGSVFEYSEGAGENELPAFNPYGVSKGLTFEIFKYYSFVNKMKLYKFVIPNPFGPYEEPRFTTYLIKNWFTNKIPSVNTPLYIRDNIHVSLLAKAYSYYCNEIKIGKARKKFLPSGYVETQGAFALRFAEEMQTRLKIKCPVIINKQADLSESLMRVNTE
ncbi:MAG: NAD(P)-dependent oxidoreductase, partial [Leptospiraceae bacterium]|nr:NAD(P)-dependent oxidoreductase [Leptospiraceae bacterium]